MLAVLLALCAGPPTPTGTLVLVGGGRMPDAVRRHFLALAGGKDARLLVIPTASASAETDPDGFLAPWKKLGPASVQILHTRKRAEADSAAFAAKVDIATGVWVSGGDQSRLSAAYGGTATERAIRRLLARGGVVGGTSAGAAIASRVMITGGTEEARTGTGWGLLDGVIVDQHLLRRDRLGRLMGAAARHGLIGLGIDEATAAVIRGGEARVLGESFVIVVTPTARGTPGVRVLRDGQRMALPAFTPKLAPHAPR